jgi:hypothetical protein
MTVTAAPAGGQGNTVGSFHILNAAALVGGSWSSGSGGPGSRPGEPAGLIDDHLF